ncbi:hypothetical protein DFH29DRAFT_1076646 [Suillus ampliporus]|nr:hypothetical protein DFH29DRAFT_1076646 [Suillus ampliporus]
MDSCASSASVRPTLPPLHTLDLPRGKTQLPPVDALYDSYEFKRQIPRLHIPSQCAHARQNRQVSISSSTSSRTPSPTPSPLSSSSSRSSTSGGQTPKIRLVPTTLEHADAVVIVPPPDAPHMHPLSGVTNLKQRAQPLLLVGPALQHIRHPQRQIAKGARLHPYRIVRSPADRRFSIASKTSA